MSWKDVLKASCGSHREKIDTEKGGCGCASCQKQQFEKKLVGNQKRIDANNDGEITGEDFAMLREKTKKSADTEKLFGSKRRNKNVYQAPQLTQEQKDKIDAFMQARGVTKEQAQNYLSQNNYNLPSDAKRLMVRKSEEKAAKDDKAVEKEILAEVKKEGGALGMKNLKGIADPTQLNKVVNAMLKRRVLFRHKNGDLYTHNPVK